MGTMLLALASLLEIVPDTEIGALIIVLIIAAIISLLPIILFFKVWRMCNDVKEIKDVLKDMYHYQELHR